MSPFQQTTIEDRMRGVMAGLAIGDALGAGYEFGPPLSSSVPIGMIGGGVFSWKPGEWTDDTSMAIPIARAVAEGRNLLTAETVEYVYQEWREWHWTAKDVGNQTRNILSGAPTADRARELADEHYKARPYASGGNGCVMRTAPIALAYLHDDLGCAQAASAYAALTHADPDAIRATVSWTLGIAYAVRTGNYPEWIWTRQLQHPDSYSERNGGAVCSTMAAASAIQWGHGVAKDSLEAAVRGGGDTDTVAAIAGGLIGGALGFSQLPAEWINLAHGWPGISLHELPTVVRKVLL